MKQLEVPTRAFSSQGLFYPASIATFILSCVAAVSTFITIFVESCLSFFNGPCSVFRGKWQPFVGFFRIASFAAYVVFMNTFNCGAAL